MIDLHAATTQMSGILARIDDAQLGRPTPCHDTTVGDLVDHVGGFALGFAAADRKATVGQSGPPPKPDATRLEAGWRDRVAGDLDALADAWRDPAAWEGMTTVGPVDLPGQVAALVALDELVVHGWDLAVATGQPFAPSDDDVRAAMSFVSSFDAPRDGNLFGPIVPVDASASPLDQLLGLTGRDPSWQPTS